jgi:hypothetical protein
LLRRTPALSVGRRTHQLDVSPVDRLEPQAILQMPVIRKRFFQQQVTNAIAGPS